MARIRMIKPEFFDDSDVAELSFAARLFFIGLWTGMVCRYVARDKRAYLWIRQFTKHQRPHPKEPASLIPACPHLAGKRHGKPGKDTADPSESGVLILDSGSLDSGTRNLESGASPPEPETTNEAVVARVLAKKKPEHGRLTPHRGYRVR